MVKPPKIRHSKPRRDPVTIDLEPEPVADDRADSPVQDVPVAEAAPQVEEEAAPASSVPPDMPAAGPDPVPPPAARRGGMVASAIIGGIVALAGAAALQYSGVLPAPGRDAGAIAALQSEIAALRDQAGQQPAADPAIAQRVEALAAEIETLRQTAGQAPEAGAAEVAALDKRIAGVEAALAKLPTDSGDSAPVDLAPLSERLYALENGLAPLKAAGEDASAEIAAVNQRIDRVEAALSKLSGEVQEQAAQPGVALAIAASALKAAVDRGTPFMTELETFAAVAPDAPEIAPLREMAAAGVPSRTAIAAGFADVASAMIAAGRAEDPNAGILDRLMTSAQSLVQVRPVGMVEGEGVPAVVARIEVAIQQGDYAQALAGFETLPAPVKAAAADYFAGLKARLAADGLVETILAAALKS